MASADDIPLPKAGSESVKPTVCVRNLPLDITEAELDQHFSQVGEIQDIILKNRGKNRGYAFITFESVDVMKRAISALDTSTLRGHTIIVEPSNRYLGITSRRDELLQRLMARKDELRARDEEFRGRDDRDLVAARAPPDPYRRAELERDPRYERPPPPPASRYDPYAAYADMARYDPYATAYDDRGYYGASYASAYGYQPPVAPTVAQAAYPTTGVVSSVYARPAAPPPRPYQPVYSSTYYIR